MLYASSFSLSLSRTSCQSAFYKVPSHLYLYKNTANLSPPRAPPHYFSSVPLDTQTVPITCQQQKHVEHRRLESSVIDFSPHVFSSQVFCTFFGGTFNSAAKSKSFTSSRVQTHRFGPAVHLSINAKVLKKIADPPMTSLSLSFCGKQAVWYCTHGILHGCVTRLEAVQRVGSMYNDPKREAAGEKQWGERTVDVAWALQKWLKCVRPILGEGCNTGEIKEEEEGKKKRVKRKAVSRLFLIPPLHVAKDDSAVWKGDTSTKWIVSQAKIQPVSFLNHTWGRLCFYFLFCFFCLVFSRNLRSGSNRFAASWHNL